MDLGDARLASFGKRLDGGTACHGLAQQIAIAPRADEECIMSHHPAKFTITPGLIEVAKRISPAAAVKRRPSLEVENPGIGSGIPAQPLARLIVSLEAGIDRSQEIRSPEHETDRQAAAEECGTSDPEVANSTCEESSGQ